MLGSSLEALAMFHGSSVVSFMTDVARSFLVSASAECWPSSDISRFDSGSSNITNTDWIQGRMSRVSNGSYVMGWGPLLGGQSVREGASGLHSHFCHQIAAASRGTVSGTQLSSLSLRISWLDVEQHSGPLRLVVPQAVQATNFDQCRA